MNDIVHDLLNLHGPGHTNYTCLKAADEIKFLRAALAMAKESERLWYDRYYTLFVSCKEAQINPVFSDWAKQVNDKYRENK